MAGDRLDRQRGAPGSALDDVEADELDRLERREVAAEALLVVAERRAHAGTGELPRAREVVSGRALVEPADGGGGEEPGSAAGGGGGSAGVSVAPGVAVGCGASARRLPSSPEKAPRAIATSAAVASRRAASGSARRAPPGRRGAPESERARRAAGSGCGKPPQAAASSRTSSPAEAGRSEGSRAIPRRSTSAAASGSSGRASRTSGVGSLRTLRITSSGVRPVHARVPDSASNATVASA